MFLSRMRFVRDAIRDPRYARLVMGPYQIHAAVWGMFADDSVSERDYLYRVDESSGVPVVYTLSERSPVCDTAVWEVETKEFAPQLQEGQRLSFVLRVNPVVTRSTPRDEDGSGKKRHCVCHRHDVVMDMKMKMKNEGPDASLRVSDIVQEAGAGWLSGRSEKAGFSCLPGSVIAGGYRQLRFMQTKKGKKNPVSISVVDLSGYLFVDEPDLFLSSLKKGLGPAKGFGCGMMMIRPA